MFPSRRRAASPAVAHRRGARLGIPPPRRAPRCRAHHPCGAMVDRNRPWGPPPSRLAPPRQRRGARLGILRHRRVPLPCAPPVRRDAWPPGLPARALPPLRPRNSHASPRGHYSCHAPPCSTRAPRRHAVPHPIAITHATPHTAHYLGGAMEHRALPQRDTAMERATGTGEGKRQRDTAMGRATGAGEGGRQWNRAMGRARTIEREASNNTVTEMEENLI